MPHGPVGVRSIEACREVWSARVPTAPTRRDGTARRRTGPHSLPSPMSAMATPLALGLFLVSLLATLGAARSFARRLDRLGTSIGLPEALVGVLTALAADAPEVTAALIALARGDRGVSVGVIVGSNVFNLVAMIGVGALAAGVVRLPREALAFEGVVGLLVLAAAAGILFHVVPPAAGAALVGVVLAPYLVLLLR